jgi:hypothetical protein
MYLNTRKRWCHVRVWRSATKEGARQEGGGVEGMEGNLNRNHLRSIPGLCVEDRINL